MRIVFDIDEPWQCGGGGKPYVGSKGGRIELVITSLSVSKVSQPERDQNAEL